MEELDDFTNWLLDDDNRDSDFERTIHKPDWGCEYFEPISETVETKVREDFCTLQRWYRIPQLSEIVDPLDAGNFQALIHAIRSMVGDDEVITSNNLVYCVLCILVGTHVPRIQISWEDVQFNKDLFNYAEGWILLPPSMDSGFESVNKYNRNAGVPFVLDPVKFKDLSAVRKQSAMDVDLASKFRNLSQKASWTNRDWITWDLHQFALVLGIEIFDFMRSKIFPYLYPWEGGCGGSPPWNNLLTASAAIFRFRGGAAKTGLLGVMKDANSLQRGEISPEEAFFTKNLNLALSGDKQWLAIRSHLENLKLEALNSGVEYEPAVLEDAENIIPQELIDKSVTINPEDAMTGVALSYLREKGYILTELDLVERVQNEFRLKSVWGNIPMVEIEDQIALRKKEYSESFHERLTEISKWKLNREVYLHYKDIDDPLSPAALLIMDGYYRIRSEQALRFNSFMYNERIRVFKQSDVEAFYARGVQNIRDAFCASIDSYYRPEHRKEPSFRADSDTFDEIEKWLDSDPLPKLLRDSIPPGVGPDDSRIVRDLMLALEDDIHVGYLILIVTSDRMLVHSAQRILRHNFPRKNIRIYGLSLSDYLSWALTTGRRSYVIPQQSGMKARFPWVKGELFNPIKREMRPIDGSLLTLLLSEGRWFFKEGSNSRTIVMYDFPNINRGLKRFKYNADTETCEEFSGGFLSKAYLQADWKFPIRSLARVRESREFDVRQRRTVYPSSALRGRVIKLLSASENTSKSFKLA
jgi:hypothetical protein